MSTNNDALIAVAPTARVAPVAPVAPPPSSPPLATTLFGPNNPTVEEAERQLRALFAAHRPTHDEMGDIAVMAQLAERAVNDAHERERGSLDAETVIDDYVNCAALYGYMLGYAAAERARRGA